MGWGENASEIVVGGGAGVNLLVKLWWVMGAGLGNIPSEIVVGGGTGWGGVKL